MDEPLTHDASREPVVDPLDQALQEQRARVQGFVTEQRGRLRSIEAQLEDRLDEVLSELQREQDETAAARTENAAQAQALRDEAAQLAERERTLDEQRVAWLEAHAEAARQHEHLNHELSEREKQLHEQTARLAEATAELRAERMALAEGQQELELNRAELARQRKRLAEKQAELDEAQERLDELESKTRTQRRNIARELREQKLAQMEEIDRQREKLEELAAAAESELQARLIAVSQQAEELRRQAALDRDELAAVRERDEERDLELAAALKSVADFEKHAQEMAAADAEMGELGEPSPQFESLRIENERLLQDLAEARATLGDAQRLLEDSQRTAHEACRAAEEARATAVAAEHAAAEARAAAEEVRRQAADVVEQGSTSQADAAELSDMRRRYEMAMEDVHELKSEKAQLEERLRAASRGAASSSAAAPIGEGMDWESQKRRLLAALESDFDQDDVHQASERLRVEEAIRQTDQVVSEKDALITQLQEQLDQQAALPEIDPAIAAAVNADDAVRQERARLAELQAAWEEKLRQAEIDLSVERAKIGRQRAELEEKLRDMAAVQAKPPVAGQENTGEKPQRGRWLARLGLRDDDNAG